MITIRAIDEDPLETKQFAKLKGSSTQAKLLEWFI